MPPLASITKTSLPPLRSLANAIVEYARANGADVTAGDDSSNDVADDETDADSPACGNEKEAAEDEPQIADTVSPATDVMTYRVQFMACDRNLPAGSAQFKGLQKVDRYVQGGFHKYTAGGDFATEAEAEKFMRSKVKKLFPQAFIIKWKNGGRVN